MVAGLGTGGTLMGVGRRLRESSPGVVVAAAEPLPGDPVMGLRSLDEGYVPPILDPSSSTASCSSRTRSRSRACGRCWLKASLPASRRAPSCTWQRLAARLEAGTVVCILADAGWKYLSADFWDAAAEDVESIMESRVWW